MSYDSQYLFVIRVVPTNGATTGSTSMTVVVSNLDTLSLSERCRMGQSGTQASVWMSSSSVLGKWSTGVESSATACVTSAKRVGSLSRAVSFGGASLAVSSVVRTNLAETGATSMTILVSNIGSVDLSGRSRVGSSGGAASAWLSSSSLGCKAGPGHDVGVSSIATSSRVVASAVKAVSYDSQYLFVIRVVPTNGATTGSTSMTVVVSNLGTLSLSERCRMGQSGTQASVWMSSSSVLGKWSPGVDSGATACVT